MQRDNERNSQFLRNGQHCARIDREMRMNELRSLRFNRMEKAASSSGSQKDLPSCFFSPRLRLSQGENRMLSQIQTVVHPHQPREHRHKPAKRACLRKNERLREWQEFVAVYK